MSARVRKARRIALGAGLLGSLVGAPPARAQDGACAAELAARVQRRYEGVRDLRGRFEQRTERASLGAAPSGALEARGEALFAKPGKMRWVYEAPEPGLVVSDGETLWIHDERAREVQRLPFGPGQLSAAGVQFLLGEGKLTEEFSVRAKACGEPTVVLELSPKRDAQYERIDLHVDAASAKVRETTVVDLFGNRTNVRFDELRENTGPDPKLFRYEAADGIRVIDVAPAP
ncbi:MAG: hypothetical protein DCC71_01955 [Proteobacteria bacterium]|nr:MAG: hypothetical protein DCC71_01955 [Pseudomonadota bacterium]